VGNCTTVGSYADGSGNLQGLLLTQTTGTWAAGVQAPLPADAASNPFAFPASLSCASAGNRTAVGQYTDSSGSTQGLLLTQTTPTCSGSGLTIAKKAPSQTGHPARPGVGPSQSPRRTAPAAICTPRRSRAAPPGGYRTPLQPQPGHGTVSIKPGNGSQTVTWTGFTLASGASASITVTVSGTVPKRATCGSSLPISGSWSATGLDASNTEVSSGHSTPGTIQVTC
jgi:hypothetical protein